MKENELESLKLKASIGDSVSQFKLGILYKEGMDELNGPNYREAFFWLEKSANHGYDQAQVALGDMYFKKFIPKEKKEMVNCQDEAIRWFRLALEQGNKEAHERLATLGLLKCGAFLNCSIHIFNKNNKSKINNSEEKKNFISRIRSNNLGTSPLSR